MEVTININDYFTSDELKEEIRFAVRDLVKKSVVEWFGDSSGHKIVHYTAKEIVEKEASKRSIDFKKEIGDAFLLALKDLDAYRVFGYDESIFTNVRTKTHAQEVLDECVDRLKPEIEERVRELYLKKLESEDAAEVLADAFYRIMEKALKEE